MEYPVWWREIVKQIKHTILGTWRKMHSFLSLAPWHPSLFSVFILIGLNVLESQDRLQHISYLLDGDWIIVEWMNESSKFTSECGPIVRFWENNTLWMTMTLTANICGFIFSVQHYLSTPTLTCGITLSPNSLHTVPTGAARTWRCRTPCLSWQPSGELLEWAEPTSSNP